MKSVVYSLALWLEGTLLLLEVTLKYNVSRNNEMKGLKEPKIDISLQEHGRRKQREAKPH